MSEEAVPRVRDMMEVGVPTCGLESPAAEVARFLLAEGQEAMVVMDGHGHAAGVVTRDDLVAAYGAGSLDGATAESIMRAEVPKVPPDIPLRTAVQIMRDLGSRVLYMMHHAGGVEYAAAVLTYDHLMRLIAAEDPAELKDLGVGAPRKTPMELFIERRDAARRRARITTGRHRE